MGVERLEVSDRLGLCQRAEGKGLAWHRQVRFHPVDQLQKQAAVGATLVELSRRMEVARPITRCGRDPIAGDQDLAQGSQGGLHLRRGCRVGQQGQVSIPARLLKQLCEGGLGG